MCGFVLFLSIESVLIKAGKPTGKGKTLSVFRFALIVLEM